MSLPMLEMLDEKLLSPLLPSGNGRVYSLEPFGSGPVGANSTLPFSRKTPGPPPNARKASASRESLLAGRTGEGEVARYSMRFAASLSAGAGRGVDVLVAEGAGGGVLIRAEDSLAVDADRTAGTESGEFVLMVRAELC